MHATHTTPLRERMRQELQLAGLSERTQEAYLRAVRQLATHFGKPPDQVTEPELRAGRGADDDRAHGSVRDPLRRVRRQDVRGRLRPLPHPRRLRHQLARMHRQSVSASLLGGLRFRAAPWWLAAPGAANSPAVAISSPEPPRSGALERPATHPSARSGHRPRPT
jgi:hypothetical protein